MRLQPPLLALVCSPITAAAQDVAAGPAHVTATLALAVAGGAALYLLALGAGAMVRPAIAKRFLGGFARTPRAHFVELAVRVVVGAALVRRAPDMAFSTGIALVGWTLIATSLALALVPWRVHQRFAAWSVPRATQHMNLIGIGSLVGGLVLAAALVLPSAARW